MRKPVFILGISAYYHDSAAALLKNGEIVAAAQEERFTRKKHDPGFPSHAIRFCLDFEGISLEDIDYVAFYDKPFLKFERLLETYYAFAPKGLRSFITAIPVWIKEKLFLKQNLRKELEALGDGEFTGKILFPEHHVSHAASAFLASPYDDAAILTVDGVGEYATTTMGRGSGSQARTISRNRLPAFSGTSVFSLHLLYRL